MNNFLLMMLICFFNGVFWSSVLGFMGCSFSGIILVSLVTGGLIGAIFAILEDS